MDGLRNEPHIAGALRCSTVPPMVSTRSTQVAVLADFGLAAFVRRKEAPKQRKPSTTPLLPMPTDADFDESAKEVMDRMTASGNLPLLPMPTDADFDESAKEMMDRMTGTRNLTGAKSTLLGAIEASVRGGTSFFDKSVRNNNFQESKSIRGGGNFFEKSVRAGNMFDKSTRRGGAYKPENLPAPKALLSGKTGSLMYMSPEMYKNENNYSEKVDVFSFGVILYEVIHKYSVFFAISQNGTEQEVENYAYRVSQGYRPPIHKDYAEEVKTIIQDCWATNPKDRPSMDVVLERLHYILDNDLLRKLAQEASDSGCCVVS
eukprot:gene5279-18525_t